MEIVDTSPTDLTVEDAARIAGRSVKTVRRAVHAGQLPMRYVLGLRGPQLVFQPLDIEHWQAARTEPGKLRSQKIAGVRPRRAGPRADRTQSIQALTTAVEELTATVAVLCRRLADQERALERACAPIAGTAIRTDGRAGHGEDR